MGPTRQAYGALLALVACALLLPAAAHAACGFLGLQRCPQPPPATKVEADGSLAVVENPHGLEALPASEQGEPLYPRPDGHLYFGMTDNALDEGTATVEELAGMVEALGGSFVRIGLPWPSVEYQRDSYTWSHLDSQYLSFVRHGVRPLWVIFYTPRFAAPEGAPCGGRSHYYCDSEPAPTTDALGELEEFGHALARRYPLAAGFEYRNEPNLDKHKICSGDPSWHIPPDVYTRGLLTFASGVHAARPDLRVLGGALSSCSYWNRGTRYLEEMLDAGAQEGMDGLSVHFSGGADGNLGPEMEEFSSVLRDRDETDIRMVAGEVGYNGADSVQASRLWSQYYALNIQDPSLDLSANYDMFSGFVAVERKDKAPRSFGWVRRKDLFGQFQAKEVFCDFRRVLGAGRPLPSYVRNCMLG